MFNDQQDSNSYQSQLPQVAQPMMQAPQTQDPATTQRQQLAKLLMQGGGDKSSTQYVNGWAVPQSAFGGLGNQMQKMAGTYLQQISNQQPKFEQSNPTQLQAQLAADPTTYQVGQPQIPVASPLPGY